jgi:hypothetical protein
VAAQVGPSGYVPLHHCLITPWCAGFAVVKRGKDKETGESVAIKVHMLAAGRPRSCWVCVPARLQGGLHRTCRLWTSRGMHQGTTAWSERYKCCVR